MMVPAFLWYIVIERQDYDSIIIIPFNLFLPPQPCTLDLFDRHLCGTE